MLQHCPLVFHGRNRPWGRRPPTALVGTVALLLPALLAGCSAINAYDDPAAVGDWQTRTATAGGRRSTMTAELEGGGDATLWYVLAADPDQVAHQDSFTVKWEQQDDTEFELRMACKSSTSVGSGCGSHDFTMTCESNGSGEKLDCTGTDFWVNFPLAWERD